MTAVAEKRLPNTFIACPIVYGSIAFYLGKKAQEYQTHSWTLYVRGPQDEDLSTFISKIAFTLHPSFDQPVREITKAPFQITETGWGEFEAGIRIFFKDPTEQPVDLFHHLRLYPPNPSQQLNPKKPVVSESYDEIVFASPFPKFHALLMQYGVSSKSTLGAYAASHSNSSSVGTSSHTPVATTAWPEHYLAFDDAMDMEMLLSIQQNIQQELLDAKKRLVDLESQVIDAQQGYTGPVPASTSSTKSSATTKIKNTTSKSSGNASNSKKDKIGDMLIKVEGGISSSELDPNQKSISNSNIDNIDGSSSDSKVSTVIDQGTGNTMDVDDVDPAGSDQQTNLEASEKFDNNDSSSVLLMDL
jgi:YEATS domain-containing protein 4